MNKIFLAFAALILIAGVYTITSRMSNMSKELDPGIPIQRANEEPGEAPDPHDHMTAEPVPDKAKQKKKGLVISRPVSPDDDKPRKPDEPEINEYGRKMVPEPETLDKKSLKAEQEFIEEEENYDHVEDDGREKDMDLKEYYKTNERDD